MKCAGETFIPFFIIRKHYKDIFKMNSTFKIVFLFSFTLFSLNFKPCSSACARAEYETSDEECCPMCAPGNRVYRDCTEFTSTTCVPCMGATFLDAPNGLKECFICMSCDPGLGLRVSTACTRTSDTVCEPVQGYYCTEKHRGSCIYAQKHTKCQPGEYIQHMGSADKDAVCERCAAGTFSNGTLQNCEPHTKCEDEGLIEVNPGTADSDTECGNKPPVGLILAIVIPIIALLAVAAAVLMYFKKKGKLQWPLPETGHRLPSTQNVPLQETQPGSLCSVPQSSVMLLSASSSCNPDSNPSSVPEETSDEEMHNPLGKSENT